MCWVRVKVRVIGLFVFSCFGLVGIGLGFVFGLGLGLVLGLGIGC